VIFNYAKLKGKIKEKYDRQDLFADELGISSVSLSAKLNNKVQFTQQEISKSCDLLDIAADEVHPYFFTQSVKDA
jgi:hypothetical protein